jgi:hypothetical protein
MLDTSYTYPLVQTWSQKKRNKNKKRKGKEKERKKKIEKGKKERRKNVKVSVLNHQFSKQNRILFWKGMKLLLVGV